MDAPTGTPTQPTTFVARTPGDLLAMVPIVLGFHPRHSVVLMTFGAGSASFHARVDLPVGAPQREEVVRMLVDAAVANEVASAAVVILSEDAPAAQAVGVELADAVLTAGIELVDVVRADGDRWWPVRPHLDPAEAGPGTPYDVRSHPFTAERVLEGRAAFHDRAALAASIEPDPAPASVADRAVIAGLADGFRDALLEAVGGAAVTEAGESARWLRRQVQRHAVRGSDRARRDVPAAVVARICALAACAGMRDVVCTLLTRRGAAAQVPLWSELARRSPDPYAEGVCAVLALVAWLAGDGALAWCAIDRCEQVAGPDPDAGARLAALVAGLLQGAVCPDRWEPPEVDDVPLLAG